MFFVIFLTDFMFCIEKISEGYDRENNRMESDSYIRKEKIAQGKISTESSSSQINHEKSASHCNPEINLPHPKANPSYSDENKEFVKGQENLIQIESGYYPEEKTSDRSKPNENVNDLPQEGKVYSVYANNNRCNNISNGINTKESEDFSTIHSYPLPNFYGEWFDCNFISNVF